MSLADTMPQTALTLISKYGRNILFTTIVTPGAYDSSTGKVSAPITKTQTVKAYAKDMVSMVGLPPNIQIKTGDKQLIVPALNFTPPNEGDTFTIGSDTYTVVPLERGGMGVSSAEVNGTPVIYMIHGRHQ